MALVAMALAAGAGAGQRKHFISERSPKEELEHQKKLQHARDEARIRQGQKKFVYRGQVVWARDLKNYMRKVKNIKHAQEVKSLEDGQAVSK